MFKGLRRITPELQAFFCARDRFRPKRRGKFLRKKEEPPGDGPGGDYEKHYQTLFLEGEK